MRSPNQRFELHYICTCGCAFNENHVSRTFVSVCPTCKKLDVVPCEAIDTWQSSEAAPKRSTSDASWQRDAVAHLRYLESFFRDSGVDYEADAINDLLTNVELPLQSETFTVSWSADFDADDLNPNKFVSAAKAALERVRVEDTSLVFAVRDNRTFEEQTIDLSHA